jgi:minimal PKS ketosynthase (KS/KS alpha)
MSEALDQALAQGRIDGSEVGYVNAHGSGTKQNDRHETAAGQAEPRRDRLQGAR